MNFYEKNALFFIFIVPLIACTVMTKILLEYVEFWEYVIVYIFFNILLFGVIFTIMLKIQDTISKPKMYSNIKKNIVPHAMQLVKDDNVSQVSSLCSDGSENNWGNLHSFFAYTETESQAKKRGVTNLHGSSLYGIPLSKGFLAAYDEGVKISKKISSENYDKKFIPSDRVTIKMWHSVSWSYVDLYSGGVKIDEFSVDKEYDKNLDLFAEWYAWVAENKQATQNDSQRYENLRKSLDLLLKEFKVISYPFDLNAMSLGEYLTDNTGNIILGRQKNNNSLLVYKTYAWYKPAKVLIAEYKDIISYEIKGSLDFTKHTTDGYVKQGEWKGTRLAAGYLLAGPVGAALIGKSKNSYIRGSSFETSSDTRKVLLKVKPARDFNSMEVMALEGEGNSTDLPTGLDSKPNLFYDAELFWESKPTKSKKPRKDETIEELELPFIYFEMLQSLYPEKEKKPGDGLYIQL